MRAIMALGCLLALSACDYDLVSKNPVIPEEELFDPAPLVGDYWLFKSEDANFTQLSISAQAGRKIRFATDDGDDEEEPDVARLLELTGPDALLSINEEGEDVASYAMLIRRANGALELVGLNVPGDNPFTAANAGYLNDVAARYGLKVELTAGRSYRAEISGFREEPDDPANPRIADLLRDPDFIAMLSTVHHGALLPVNSPRKGMLQEIDFDPSPPLDAVRIDTPADIRPVPGKTPGNLVGVYEAHRETEQRGSTIRLPDPVVHWRKEQDGWFVSDELNLRAVFHPLIAEEPTYAGVRYETEDRGSDNLGTLFVLQKDDDDEDCWAMIDIGPSRAFDVEELDQMRRSRMSNAANNHGLSFNRLGSPGDMAPVVVPFIDGVVSIDMVADLLHDGAFTMGLAVVDKTQFCPPGDDEGDEGTGEGEPVEEGDALSDG